MDKMTTCSVSAMEEMKEVETATITSAATSITKKSTKKTKAININKKNVTKAQTTSKSLNNKNAPKRNKPKSSHEKKNSSKELLPLTDLVLGSTIEGHVRAFTSFGIFVKTNYDFKNKKGSNGGYALLHKSQITDEPVEDLTKLFRIGAKVKGLRVINIDYTKGEVGLSLRKQRGKRQPMTEVPVGPDLQGTVTKVTSYGAFVDIGAEVNALVHISRISQKKVRNIREFINEGDEVIIHLLSKDEKKKTMAASMLDQEADQYLSKRTKQMQRMRESVEVDNLKSELEYLEDAVRELEEVFNSE